MKTDLSTADQIRELLSASTKRQDGERLFRRWCGNSYEWDALTDLEKQRWHRLSRNGLDCPALIVAVDALESAAESLDTEGVEDEKVTQSLTRILSLLKK
jgi:hypothetical protein